MREALLAPGLPRLEPQAGEPVAADELVAAAGGRDEHEAAAPAGRAGAGRRRERGWLAGSAAEVMGSMIGPDGRSCDGPLSKV